MNALVADAASFLPKLSFVTGRRECSEAGIKFLMMDTYNQLWQLLKQYIEAAATRSGVVPHLRALACATHGPMHTWDHYQTPREATATCLPSLFDLTASLRSLTGYPLGHTCTQDEGNSFLTDIAPNSTVNAAF